MKLIDEARQWWRLWSVRVTGVMTYLAGILCQNTPMVLGLIGFIPAGPLRTAAAGAVGFIVFGLPIIAARLAQQPGLEGK